MSAGSSAQAVPIESPRHRRPFAKENARAGAQTLLSWSAALPLAAEGPQPRRQMIRLARRDIAKQVVDPAFMCRRHIGECGLSLCGQPHERGTSVAIALRACDEAVRCKAIDDPGDVPVGYQQ